MNLIRLFTYPKLISIIILTSLCSLIQTQTTYSCSVTANDGSTKTGTASYSCDPRCVPFPGFAGMYCCLSASALSFYDCLYQCNPNSADTLVGNVYLWPDAVTPTRCDTACPPHYYVLAGSASGTQCSICHDWCFDCTDNK